MSKHTPKPWSYACDSGHSTPCLRGVQHSKKAVVYSEDRTIASHIANWDDAMLISAAPELLAACKAVVGLIEAMHEVPPTRANMLRAAIRKSEGHQ